MRTSLIGFRRSEVLAKNARNFTRSQKQAILPTDSKHRFELSVMVTGDLGEADSTVCD
jgi:hypothetical protein